MGKKQENPGPDRAIPIREQDADLIAAEFDMNVSRAVLRGDPNNVIALHTLGNSLTRLGRHEEALEIDKRLTTISPDDETAFYNLACSYSNLGLLDDAISALRRAVALGYENIEFMQKDPDLSNVRRDPRFKRIVEEIRRRRSLGSAR